MPSQVYHLGGGVINRPNITLNERGEVSDYDIGPLLMELNMQASLYAGTGNQLCAHYSLSLSPDESLTPYQCLVAARLLMSEWDMVAILDGHLLYTAIQALYMYMLWHVSKT